MLRLWSSAWICLLILVLPAVAQDEAQGPAADDRSSFSIVMTDKFGGGRVEGRAGDYEIQMGQSVVATGGVEIKYRDLRLQAETLRIDIPTNVLTAEGSIILDEGPRRLIGDILEYNLEDRTGRLQNATAFVEDQYYFTGDEINKVSDDTFNVQDGVFSSCSQETPAWSIKMGKADVTVDDYARIRQARMRFGKVPVFWVPYMVWPTTTDRSSGFLVPQPGFSTRRGFEMDLAYYKTLGRSADVTFQFNASTQEYYGFGTELRYKPSENSEGIFEGMILNDPEIGNLFDYVQNPFLDPINEITDPNLLPDETRWRVRWFHETKDLWGGFRAVVNFVDFSDPTFRQDFDRNVRRQTNNFIHSQTYLSRNFGRQSLNILVDQRERIRLTRYEIPGPVADFLDIQGDTNARQFGEIIETRRQLPEIEYRLRPTRLGNSLVYFNMDANFHVLQMESRSIGESTYERGDFLANVSIPVSTLPWLSVKADVGGRITHYGNSLNSAGDGRFFGDESQMVPEGESEQSLTRQFSNAVVEIVGPSFSKIFDRKPGGRFEKMKHIIEPRIEYVNRDFFGDLADRQDMLNADDDLTNDITSTEFIDEIPLFDELDRFRPLNEARFALINRILAKPSDPEMGGSFELMSFELSMPYIVDEELSTQFERIYDENGNQIGRTPIQQGPLRALLRYNPSRETSLKIDTRYNTTFNEFQSLSLSGGVKLGKHTVGGSLSTRWRFDQETQFNETASNQLRLATKFQVSPRLTFDANVSFDLETDNVNNPLQQRYFLEYTGSCYSFRLELRESQFNDIEDRDFRFSFTLKNVGTFIDMNGSY